MILTNDKCNCEIPQEDANKSNLIYLIVVDDTFPYVGKTSRTLRERMKEHFTKAKNPDILIDLYIRDAQDIQVYILEECPNNDIILDAAETVQIRRIQRMLIESYGKEAAQKMLKNQDKVIW